MTVLHPVWADYRLRSDNDFWFASPVVSPSPTSDLPTSLSLNPELTIFALFDLSATLALRAGSTACSLGPGATTLALHDPATSTPLDARTSTLLLDG